MRVLFSLVIGALLWSTCLVAQAQRRLSYRDWRVVLFDDFDTYRDVADMAVRGPWKFTPDGFNTLLNAPLEEAYFEQAGTELHDGNLHLVAQPLPEPLLYRYTNKGHDSTKLLHYRSGWIMPKEDFKSNAAWGDTSRWPGNRGFQYGLFEIRCKLSRGTGIGPAFWLYSGPTEIDVLEAENPRRASNNVHYIPKEPEGHRVIQQIYDYTKPVDLAADFHTYSVIWTATEVSFYLDRELLRTVTAAQVPTYAGPVNVIACQGVASYADLNTWPGLPGQKRADMVIDYIKVYKPKAVVERALAEQKQKQKRK